MTTVEPITFTALVDGVSGLSKAALELIELHLDSVLEFKREVCDKSNIIDPDEERDWFDLSIGFFLAKGITTTIIDDRTDDADKCLDAIYLAIACRYQFHYWC